MTQSAEAGKSLQGMQCNGYSAIIIGCMEYCYPLPAGIFVKGVKIAISIGDMKEDGYCIHSKHPLFKEVMLCDSFRVPKGLYHFQYFTGNIAHDSTPEQQEIINQLQAEIKDIFPERFR